MRKPSNLLQTLRLPPLKRRLLMSAYSVARFLPESSISATGAKPLRQALRVATIVDWSHCEHDGGPACSELDGTPVMFRPTTSINRKNQFLDL